MGSTRAVALNSVSAALLYFLGVALILVPNILAPWLQHRLQAGIKDAIVWTQFSDRAVDARFRGDDPSNLPPDVERFYLFNISNLDEVRLHGAKPSLVELGPYAYYRSRVKLDVLFSRSGLVSFKEWDYHRFAPELTTGQLDDQVATLNMPLIGALETLNAQLAGPRAQYWLDVLAEAIEQFRDDDRNHGMFTVRTVKELLWGYEDKLLGVLHDMLPTKVDTTSFALLGNDSTPDAALALPPSLVDTGSANFSNVWNYVSVSGVTEVSTWNNCSERVRGSDAFQFPPGLGADASLTVWAGELYRAARLVVKEQTELMGVKLLRFWPDPEQGEPNACHDQHIKGLMNTTRVMAKGGAGAAVLMSMPHFCLADDSLAEAVDGIHCHEPNHTTVVDVEPVTGITMRAFKRIMLSSQLGSAAPTLEPRINGSLVIPIFWAEETSQIMQADADKFKGSVYRVLNMLSMLRTWPLPVGCVLLALATVLAVSGVQAARQSFRRFTPRRRTVHTAPSLLASGGSADDLEDPLLLDQDRQTASGSAGRVVSHKLPHTATPFSSDEEAPGTPAPPGADSVHVGSAADSGSMST